MKFLIFSDLHHATGSFDGGTYEDLKFFEQRAKTEGCDFIIHAGDLCHGSTIKDNPSFVAAYNSLDIPTYHCLGNHEADGSSFEDLLRDYKMENDYYYIDGKDARLIVLNPNYYYEDGKYVNYSMANYHPVSSRDHMPPKQLAWLEETIESSENPCILLSHQSFERPDGVKNKDAVLEIINKANARRKNSVVLCINGHYHKDYMRMMDGVCFWEVNSASFEVLEHRHNHYPKELCEKIVHINATLVINDPICAVVTVSGNSVDVKGMKSSFFMDVTKDMTDDPFLDAAGREATAEIRDFHIDFDVI